MLRHVQPRPPFGGRQSAQAGFDYPAMAGLDQPVPEASLRYGLASGSAVEAWVSFERLWSWKLASALRPPRYLGGSPEPSFCSLDRGSGLDQRTTDREVGKSSFTLGCPSEHRMIPDCAVDADSGELAQQQVYSSLPPSEAVPS